MLTMVADTGGRPAPNRSRREGLENPESVVIGQDGRLYVTVIGKSDTDGDGTVVVIEDGKPKTFANGLDDPKGLVAHGTDLYVADKTRVWKIDAAGKANVYAAADAFPITPKFFNDIEVSTHGRHLRLGLRHVHRRRCVFQHQAV